MHSGQVRCSPATDSLFFYMVSRCSDRAATDSLFFYMVSHCSDSLFFYMVSRCSDRLFFYMVSRCSDRLFFYMVSRCSDRAGMPLNSPRTACRSMVATQAKCPKEFKAFSAW